ncbi:MULTISPECIES: hypothetical protein [unclassified Streptomyces]|uniref:hypothetical protein n=1 Tax=unclassified Streptomyces TaxID=2593676 RepID=UPI002FEF2EA2
MPTGPAKTMETACDGYRRAIEAHRQAAPPSRVDPGIAEAVERQNRAMRELRRRAFPEPVVVPDDVPAPIEQARAERRAAAGPARACCPGSRDGGRRPAAGCAADHGVSRASVRSDGVRPERDVGGSGGGRPGHGGGGGGGRDLLLRGSEIA